MQQLTLQFDGYADSRPVIDVSTTKPCKENWLDARNSMASELSGITISNRMAIQGTVAVAVSFALMFLAAIIQGV